MSNQTDTEMGHANLENNQRSELINLFGCLHNALNEKPWNQIKVSGCLLDITTKFDYDNKKINELAAMVKRLEKILTFAVCHKGCGEVKLEVHNGGVTCAECGEELDDRITSVQYNYLQEKRTRK